MYLDVEPALSIRKKETKNEKKKNDGKKREIVRRIKYVRFRSMYVYLKAAGVGAGI